MKFNRHNRTIALIGIVAGGREGGGGQTMFRLPPDLVPEVVFHLENGLIENIKI